MIDTGVDKLTQIQRDIESRSQARAASAIWNRIHSFLRSVPGKTPQEHVEFCTRLESTPPEHREGLIESEYGKLCLGKVTPLLHQLTTMES